MKKYIPRYKALGMMWVIAALLFANFYMVMSIDGLNRNLEEIESQSLDTQVLNFNDTVEKNIPIVSVSENGKGNVGTLKVKLIPGNDEVLINTYPFSEPDLEYSINKEVMVAKEITGHEGNNDFVFSIDVGDAQSVSGGSAGAPMAVDTVAAINGLNLRNDTIMTGTIDIDGSIGPVGGILEKAEAAAKAGYKNFLIPKGQSNYTYYEKEVIHKPLGFGIYVSSVDYNPKSVDTKTIAKSRWDLNIIEVSNVTEALEYYVDKTA